MSSHVFVNPFIGGGVGFHDPSGGGGYPGGRVSEGRVFGVGFPGGTGGGAVEDLELTQDQRYHPPKPQKREVRIPLECFLVNWTSKNPSMETECSPTEVVQPQPVVLAR